jgi:hypothetical protein
MEKNPDAWVSVFDVRLFSVCARHRRDREPSRRGFSFERAVLAALAVDPIRVAAKKTDTA